ncbi:MAG: NUDIX hydrolase [Dehalococcoidales bacterium]|jgi:ADP-ribose pyrophosphatase YjhB (NUDIX family)|nr:NUDIX hydrolase [Dehalococcoidales bacterium]MDP6632956.1 NUDIX hydrolase [Dehalococcoidales bacterium]MDP6824888.1 NUDIX hydrolase [Dehalococcoidales bacterium]
MITFDEGELRFSYRVVGIAVDKGRVLLQTGEGEGLWALPGGRGELMEPSEETLKREMREELDTDVRVGRLIWVMENFFRGNDLSTGNEMSCHELGFYFLMELPAGSPLRQAGEFHGIEEKSRLLFKWHDIDNLREIPLVPSFLKSALKRIPETTEHIVHTAE